MRNGQHRSKRTIWKYCPNGSVSFRFPNKGNREPQGYYPSWMSSIPIHCPRRAEGFRQFTSALLSELHKTKQNKMPTTSGSLHKTQRAEGFRQFTYTLLSELDAIYSNTLPTTSYTKQMPRTSNTKQKCSRRAEGFRQFTCALRLISRSTPCRCWMSPYAQAVRTSVE